MLIMERLKFTHNPMAIVKVHNMKGDVVGEQEMNPTVFEIAVNDDLVHQAVVAQQANSRVAIAHTKIRSEVRGGGRKPWKQKGTGRARHGSSRSPLWRGGGITFGPRNDRNFSKKINKKMKNKALRMVLSDKLAHDKVLVIDTLDMEQPKTKVLLEMISKLSVVDHKVLMALSAKQEAVIKAAKNLPRVQFIAADSLNVVDVLNSDVLLLDQAAIDKITEVYTK